MASFHGSLLHAQMIGPVGFQTVELPDSARQYRLDSAVVARPLHLMLWYPARGAPRTRMRLRDYVRSAGRANDRGSVEAVARYREALGAELGTSLDAASFDRFLEERTRATLDAPPAAGRHAVLLLEVGLNAPAFIYSHLAETLAARGVVVAVVPSFGTATGQPLTLDSAGVATQLADLEHANRGLRRLSYVDSTKIAAGGWSVGALAAFLLAAQQASSVRAFVSLDGAVGYEYGSDLLRQLNTRPSCVHTPFLHLTGTRPSTFRVAKSRALFEALPGPEAYWATVPGVAHGDFTSYYGIRSPRFRARDDRQNAIAGTMQLQRTVAAFLDAYLSGETRRWRPIVARDPIEQLKAAPPDSSCPPPTSSVGR